MVIFDCNGVLVDSEPIAAAVLADALGRVGVRLSAADRDAPVSRPPAGRHLRRRRDGHRQSRCRPIFRRRLRRETLRRLRTELRPIAHAAHALTWIRGPKAVASSSPPERIRTSLEVTGLMRFFEPRLFLGERRAQGQTGARSFLARGGAHARSIRQLHRGRGFGAGHRRGGGGGHDADRLCRRQSTRRASLPPICSPPAPAPSSPTCGP